jgi:hypothetical protein
MKDGIAIKGKAGAFGTSFIARIRTRPQLLRQQQSLVGRPPRGGP